MIIIVAHEGPSYRTAQAPNLYQQIFALRLQMAQAAQAIYDGWTQDDEGMDEELGGGGICDEIAQQIQSIIAMHIPDVEMEEYGHDGDEHAATVVRRGIESYYVDIPYSVYETGGGYNWKKIPGVAFSPEHVVVSKI